MTNKPKDFNSRKITLQAREEPDLFESGTVQDLMDAGGSLIDGCMEPPLIVFQVEGSYTWWVGSVEFDIREASAKFVRGELEDQILEIDSRLEDEQAELDTYEAGEHEMAIDGRYDDSELAELHELKEKLLAELARLEVVESGWDEMAQEEDHDRRALREAEATVARLKEKLGLATRTEKPDQR